MNLFKYFEFLAVCTISLASFSSAQLLSGDAVGFFAGQCKVGNTTLAELGISEFNTTIAAEALTWTIGTERVDDKINNQSFYDRNYFLGTPLSLQLINSSSVRSCALFFEGISSRLQFPGNLSEEYNDGTCSDALGELCVTDLISQSKAEIKNLLGATGKDWTESVTCRALEAKLQNMAPDSCKLAHSRGWGPIIVRPLTGSEAAPISEQINCHPTTGKDYNVSLVSSTKATASLYSWTDELQSYMLGITPVMTIFYPYSTSTNSSIDSSEMYLSCLKVMGSTKGEVGGIPGKTGAAPRRLIRSMTAIIAALFELLILL